MVFKGLGNFASMMKQAQQLSGRMQEVSQELKSLRTTGSAGGGMVEIEINGAQEILACRIEPSLVTQGDRELLEDLITAATNQAIQKSRQLQADAMKAATGGLELPGLDDALANLTGGADEPDTPS
jgi:DNA-binding YbaB/EbfC family protein